MERKRDIIVSIYTSPSGITALISGIVLAALGAYNKYASLLAFGILLALSPGMLTNIFVSAMMVKTERPVMVALSSTISVVATTIPLSFLYVYYK